MLTPHVKRLIADALEEDLGPGGDITSRAVISEHERGLARFVTREPVLIAGLDLAGEVFAQLDAGVAFKPLIANGDWLDAGGLLAEVEGPVHSLLAGERTALNFLQHLSAIATKTHNWTERLAPYETRLLDTRKTLPGWRALQKEAVRLGGGLNHRFGLFDGILIKDNHIKAVGGVEEAIRRIRDHYPYRKIEIEVASRVMAERALGEGADILLLDNMTPQQCAEIVTLARSEALTEASGGINDDTLEAYAASGVDFLSAGALTHSVRAVDIAMKL